MVSGNASLAAVVLLFSSLSLLSVVARGAAPVTIATDDTSVTIQVEDGRLALASLKCVQSGYEWIDAGATPPAIPLIRSVEREGQRVAVRWKLVSAEVDKGEAGLLVVTYACDEPAMTLRSTWRARKGPGPVEHSIAIVNNGKSDLLLPLQTTLAFEAQAPAGHALVQWSVDKGANTPTAGGVYRQKIGEGYENVMVSRPYASETPRDRIPWTSIEDAEGGRGWYAGIEFTGLVRLGVKGRSGTRVAVDMGIEPGGDGSLATRLPAGGTFEAPTVFVGCHKGDVEDGANRLRKWVAAHLVPAVREARYPLLTNNSWGSGMQVDERLAQKMIDESAEMGLEMFHIDAGWFRTVGDWRPHAGKFPKGLGPVADYAHEKGLKFGLWVAWTQGGDVADDTGGHGIMSVRDPLYREWFTIDLGKDWKPGPFTGAPVCLGEPKAAEWSVQALRGIVKEAKLDLLEHDQIMIVDACGRKTHLHTAARSDVAYHAARGYYRVHDALLREFPDLLLENCVNGGHMVDYGAVRRCHYISITDTYDPLSNRRAFYDATYALPAAMCECYVENVAVRSLAHFKYMVRSGMMGWCTIMTDTSKWTAQQHEAAKQQFALYKARLRPLIQKADLYHVSERPDGVRWDGIQYFDPQAGKGVLFAFRGKNDEGEHVFKLRGLKEDGRYQISSEDGGVAAGARTGAELMRDGVKVKLGEAESSELVWIGAE